MRDLLKIMYMICVLLFSLPSFSGIFMVRVIKRDIIINAQTASCKVPVNLIIF